MGPQRTCFNAGLKPDSHLKMWGLLIVLLAAFTLASTIPPAYTGAIALGMTSGAGVALTRHLRVVRHIGRAVFGLAALCVGWWLSIHDHNGVWLLAGAFISAYEWSYVPLYYFVRKRRKLRYVKRLLEDLEE
jgi:hypothetical protein